MRELSARKCVVNPEIAGETRGGHPAETEHGRGRRSLPRAAEQPVRLSHCNAAGKGEKRLREKSVIIVNALPPSLLIYHRGGGEERVTVRNESERGGRTAGTEEDTAHGKLRVGACCRGERVLFMCANACVVCGTVMCRQGMVFGKEEIR